MKVAIYARVSTEEQVKRELSIPAQIETLKKYAEEKNWEIYKVYKDEGISGATEDRPAFQEMINEALKKKPPFNYILVWEFSRFARSREIAVLYKAKLKRRGIKVISYTQTAGMEGENAEIYEGFIELMDEAFIKFLRREVMRGMKKNAQSGYTCGGTPPYGYRYKEIKVGENIKKTWEIDREKAEVVREIFELYRDGVGLKRIAEYLNSKGIKPTRNKTWSTSTLRGMLRNEAYLGKFIWNRKRRRGYIRGEKPEDEWIVIENHHEPIIDEELWNEVRKEIKKRSPKTKITSGRAKRKYLLSGLIYCGLCGSRYVVWSHGKNGRKSYRCQKAAIHKCSNPGVSLEQMDKAVLDSLLQNILTTGSFQKFLNEIRETEKKEKKIRDKKYLKRRIERIDKKIERITKLIVNDLIPEDIGKRQLEELNTERRGLIRILNNLNLSRRPFSKNDIKIILQNFRKIIKEDPQKLKLFIKKVVVFPERLEIYYTFENLNVYKSGAGGGNRTHTGYSPEGF